ncbi:uncharacterized protein [Ptychodera flava]
MATQECSAKEREPLSTQETKPAKVMVGGQHKTDKSNSTKFIGASESNHKPDSTCSEEANPKTESKCKSESKPDRRGDVISGAVDVNGTERANSGPGSQGKQTVGSKPEGLGASSSDKSQAKCDLSSVNVTLKHNKDRHKLNLLEEWDGETVMTKISEFLQIPIHGLKLVHKGKMANKDNVKNFVTEKAVFQAIGEPAESEYNLVSTDVDIICEQLSCTRNVAIRALRKTGDLVDAMFLIGNFD